MRLRSRPPRKARPAMRASPASENAGASSRRRLYPRHTEEHFRAARRSRSCGRRRVRARHSTCAGLAVRFGSFFRSRIRPFGRGRNGLRRGVVENVLVFGKERGLRFALAGGDGEAEAGGRGLEDRVVGRWKRLGKRVGKPVPQSLIGSGNRCRHGRGAQQLDVLIQLGFAGNADLAADKPIDLGVQNGRAGSYGCRRLVT